MRVQTTRPFILSLISALLSACAGTKDAVLPHDGPTMKAIYDAHFEHMNGASTASARAAVGPRALIGDQDNLAGYTRQSDTELDTHFPRLPNPTLVMYVFPHLAGPVRVPIPGYSTTFPMYEHTGYALPGEIPVHTTGPTLTAKERP